MKPSFLLSGHYKVQLFDPRTNGFAPSSPGIGMHVEIRDPDDKIILSKVYSTEGKWTFTSSAPGNNLNLTSIMRVIQSKANGVLLG